MTLLLATLLACADDGLSPASDPIFSVLTFTDAYGGTEVDEHVRLERWDPVSGTGCEPTTEVANYAGPDPMEIGFTTIFDAAGRGRTLSTLDAARQELGVWWVDPADATVFHYLTEYELTVETASAEAYEFTFENGSIGTMVDNGEATFEAQESPVTVSLALLDGGVLDRGAITDGAADQATDPDTDAAICVR